MQPANEEMRKYRALETQCDQLFRAGEYAETLEKCNEGVKAFPDHYGFYTRRVQVLFKLNRLDAARRDLDETYQLAVARKATMYQATVLGVRADLDARQGSYPLAVKDLESARRLNPADSTQVNSLAWIRATCPVSEMRNGREGVKLAKTALALKPHRAWAVLDTLAAAYAEANDYPHAVETEKRALADAQKTVGSDESAAKFVRVAPSRVQLFEHGQPYHHDTWQD